MKYYCLCVQFDFLSLSGGYSFSSVNKLNVVVLRVIMILTSEMVSLLQNIMYFLFNTTLDFCATTLQKVQASSHYIGQAQYDLLYLSAK